ncbi:ultraviolet-B receptor UVR8-like isoform X2 [Argentina anserina]|uniref:ultraviolet-B receptor UVR8-like isoform X2 n=1 Tax=Argentina anserina TaxID=57926 RepID=UPI00217623D9|nr:ultraviolet-B receptor UVR8-like isoform X2 [Potentilla anserina]
MNGNEGAKMESRREAAVYMSGYLPGVSPEKSPMLSLEPVKFPDPMDGGDSWKEVCGGGCGFAMAISESGRLMTWGSADEEGQSYLVAGKHGETPGSFPLPNEASVVKAAAGWAHCVSVTESGEVYTWGWKECVPSGKVFHDLSLMGSIEKDAMTTGKLSYLPAEQGRPLPRGFNFSSETVSHLDGKRAGEEVSKRRKTSSAKLEPESSSAADELFMASPCLVTMGPGVRITTVAAGGRHTLALSVSDMGQVWGWGYGGEGQLGLGSRMKMVSAPHLIPCIDQSASGKDRLFAVSQGGSKSPGSFVKEIACGGRHSAVITDTGALLTFGWGLYGQCGQGNTKDQLKATPVESLVDTRVKSITAGLWHTVCISVDGHIYAFGGNQFGQLGTGCEEAETLPRLLNSSSLENKHAKAASCGARHSTILTDGHLFSWGWNKYGQLGLGDSVDRNLPCKVSLDGCLPKHIACGWWHTLMLADIPN